MTLIGTGDDGKAAAAGGKLIQGKDGSGNAQHVLVDTDGRLDLGTVTVTGAAGGTSSIDDAAFTAGSGTGTPIMGFVTADAVDSGDVGVVGMDVNRNLKVSIEADNVGIGGGIQYTEDDAAAANPVGNALIGVRADSLAGVTTTDGDNVAARMTDKGELYVKHADSVAVTSSTLATEAKQDTIIGHVDGIEGILTTIDGDTGNISTKIDTLAGAVTGNEMQVDVLTMPTVTVDSELPDAAALADNASNPTAPAVGSFGMLYDGSTWDRARSVAALGDAGTAAAAAGVYGYNGTTWDRLRSDTTNGLDVDVTRVTGTVTVDASGTTVPVSNAGLTELAAAINSSKVDVNISSSDVSLGGTSAADDADFTAGTTAGTPSMGVYESTPTSVTDGDLGTVGITQGRRLKTSATIDAALPAGTNNIGDVDIASSVLPSGASTSANQTTIIGHLDGVETLLGTIDADTSNISTKIDTLAGAVSGTEVQVDVLTMPTTTVQATNLDIRDLTAASDSVAVHGDVGVFDQFDLTNSNPAAVAIVDSNGDQITSFGGGTQYTEDAAAAANPVGTALNLIRADSLAGITTADGDNLAARGTDKGELYVKHVDSIPVTGTFYQATQPVSGTVTAELSAVDNAVLDNIDADLTTIIGHVDGLETLIGTTNTTLGTIDTDTGNIATAVQVIDNAIHVDDAAFTLGTSSGVMMMGFAGTQSVNANDAGAIAMETDGAIHIHDGGNTITVDGTVAVTGVSTLAEQQTQTTHLATIAGDTTSIQTAVELIDDAVYVDDADWTDDTSKHLLVGGVYQSSQHTVTDGDVSPLAVDSNGNLRVNVVAGSAAGTEYSENAATPATPQGPTIMIERDDALSTPVIEGDWMGLKGDANGALYVTLATKLDSTNDSIEAVLSATDNAVLDAIAASVAAIDTDATTIIGHVDGIEGLLTTIDTDTGNAATSLAVMDDWDNAASDGASVSGDVAHDTADAGEPVKVGYKAESSPKGITLVADGDRTNGYADLDGLQMVKLNTSYADIISERVSNTNGSATAFSNFGAVASTKNYITSITVYNSSATAGYVDFTDGSGGTTKWTMPLPAGSGSVISSAMPLFSTSANTALYFDVSAALSTVYISVSGFQSKL